MTESSAPIDRLLTTEEGDTRQARERFLEASRRYLFELALPAAHEAGWLLAAPARRPWISSRVARRSRAWPAASGPWDRR